MVVWGVEGGCNVNVMRNFNDWEVVEYKSCYDYIMDVGDSRQGNFPAKQIWRNEDSRKIAFFAWEASRNCILTIDNFMKIGRVMVNGCYMCKQEAESCNYLLLWCLTVYNNRTMMYGLLGVCWVVVE